ncbi:hypothetical protein SCALIN_C29_0099 [Candidatus Scalindua japonica]|uniref:Uncharacterized protein n=1 Tax=Candidatus Scalindua japonica TaxID=1284222 RepID=A0A286U2G6_9BACT|nr:hypothetical protein SCALIN_C29_0099 [Candidatus Scalindua japonica]
MVSRLRKILHRFVDDIVTVDTVWDPHNLAKKLYQENPDSVVVYKDGHLYHYFPSVNYIREH